ncbi:MAG: LacI family DNA-binding transcriptional regulator [Nocardioides sp.]
MVTITQIARELGLSKSTVSRALRGLPTVSPETIEAVQAKAAQLDYVPSVAAAGLSIGRNHAIGVLVPSLNRWFYSSVVTGIDRALAELGYDVVLFDLDRNHAEVTRVFERSLLRRRVDALIVVATTFSDPELLELTTLDIPIIAVGPPAPGLRTIGVDDDAIMTTATEHILELGHRRLGFLGGYDRESLTSEGATRRERAFMRAAQAAGAVVDPRWVLPAEYRLGSARRMVGEMLASQERPTALVCASDEMAVGAISAVLDAGLSVPQDISVIGIDGHEYADAFDLTSCAQDVPSQGGAAARQLVAEVQGAEPPASFAPAAYELVVRGSTAPPRASG